MRFQKGFVSALILVMLLSGGLVSPATAQSTSFNRQIPSGGTTSLQSAPGGGEAAGIQAPEFPGAQAEAGAPPYNGTIIDRSLSHGSEQGASANSGKKAKSNPELNLSFNGLNFRQQRLANGGNQFSIEPPDQGLCVGNGYVVETINDVIRVFDKNGSPLTGVVDLNTFYGYPPAIIRATGVRGPEVTDPSCLFDPDTQRFYQVVLTLDTTPGGAFTGPNHLDIAVSQTSDPTGVWTIYRVPVQDDGTQGTPNHGCSFGPCIGDYPHIGADAYGFYITTNEYSFFGPEYKSAQIYAFSKRQLASGGGSISLTQLDTTGLADGNPGFTVWPAISPANQSLTNNNGTEFFLSSDAAEEANGTGVSSQIWQWSLTNTASLDSPNPALSLALKKIAVQTYAIPPKSDQKAGDFPLGQCLNSTACATNILLGGPDPYAPEPLSPLDSNDTRMQQVFYANGKLWSALDTAVTVNGVNKAGIEYFVVNPSNGKVVQNGYLALANNNLIYPALAVTPSGRGVMAFTVVGQDYYPSAGYASVDTLIGVGDIHIAAAGLGPQDGFTGYKIFVGDPPRPRWGDYGAAVLDGNSIWMASEYIAQTCTLNQYLTAPIGSCGGTRATLGNWATRISKVTP